MAYIGLFLIRRVLEWFEFYLTKIQLNGMSTTNIEAWYMFLIERVLEWFKPYFTKIQLNGISTTNIEV